MSTASTPVPDTTTGPMATVREYIASFNTGDVNGMAARCAVPMSILDGMAPHIWHGPTACQDWYRDVLVEGEHAGAASMRRSGCGCSLDDSSGRVDRVIHLIGE